MTADGPADTPPPPEDQCPPCRGTGEVVSNDGGEPKTVKCPWCEGTGRWTPQHDAQARFREQTQE